MYSSVRKEELLAAGSILPTSERTTSRFKKIVGGVPQQLAIFCRLHRGRRRGQEGQKEGCACGGLIEGCRLPIANWQLFSAHRVLNSVYGMSNTNNK